MNAKQKEIRSTEQRQKKREKNSKIIDLNQIDYYINENDLLRVVIWHKEKDMSVQAKRSKIKHICMCVMRDFQ